MPGQRAPGAADHHQNQKLFRQPHHRQPGGHRIRAAEAIAIKSVNRDDLLISRYRLEALADDCCRVTLSVQGRNEKSKLKTWNYWVMSLPVFRSGARKRLAIQLQRLKGIHPGRRRRPMIVVQSPLKRDFIISLLDGNTIQSVSFKLVKQEGMNMYFEHSGDGGNGSQSCQGNH